MSYLSYSKVRPFLIGLLVLGVFYNIFFYLEDRKLEKMKPQSFRIIEQYCWATKNSSIYIEYRDKKYPIRMANGECPKYPVGAEIYLVYNDRHDYFYQPDGLRRDSFRLFFFSFLLLLSIIPWDSLLKKKHK